MQYALLDFSQPTDIRHEVFGRKIGKYKSKIKTVFSKGLDSIFESAEKSV